MNSRKSMLCTSLFKKFLMAITGLIMVGFVLVHMIGNLLVFAGPDAINTYAYGLHSLPAAVMWGARLFLLGAVGVHIWMAVLLTIENKKARPEEYQVKTSIQSSYSSRTMPMSGLIILSFIIFHILHYTARVVPTMEYEEKLAEYALPVAGGGTVEVFDVYSMMISGFSNLGVSLFYLVAMGLLCTHLTHGVSSMFQSVGLRNAKWRARLNNFAAIYGFIIFIGFASIPVGVLSGKIQPLNEKHSHAKIVDSATASNSHSLSHK